MKTKVERKKKKAKKKLSPQEKAVLKEQKSQRAEISSILKNIGFFRLPYIDGKHFQYDGKKTEMDDIFIYKNVILIVEYTIGTPGEHLLMKNYFYNKVNSDKRAFIDFLLEEEKLNSFKSYYEEHIKGTYTKNQLILKTLYCSKQAISDDHKCLANDDIAFFDYHIVKYFSSLTKVIKRTSKFEFLDFLRIPHKSVGDNLNNSSKSSTDTFSGHILPEEKSSFKEGYKIVSFYIDAESLLKRAYVFRQSGWRDVENVGHYQRMLVSKKINSMRKYLSEKDRVFINNIISSIATDKIKLYDSKGNELKLNSNGQFLGENSIEVMPASIEINDECNIIGIIDGQHRTFAYHEGDDQYEKTISKQRKIQNLLVTGILFPSGEPVQKRINFEANLFLEINSNQTNASSQLKQEIELMLSPFSSVAIAKKILQGLNKSGPLGNLIEQYWYETGKIKTASIVSYGLRPLIKIEDVKAKDSIYAIWDNSSKHKLKTKDEENFDLLEQYVNFCVEKIRDIFIAFKASIPNERWHTYAPNVPQGVLTVTFINGVLNVLRLLIESGKISSIEDYKIKLTHVSEFDFRAYKSSQYRKMGEDIFNKYFAN
ncbi:DGQHR domain-containing protein [Parabacteroides sp. PF5-6]|uniref:DGQHR domain-containing protein n=1 Tax=Parabacteroides sp. PF5-6 TaxID=1742403 RepID=UPI002405B1DF|nr:DGQHR domain-containing protein [Parabacteroides sp. PF5-6]MDF9830672.1 DGQHR domain-containing protein [Parabacteroides sp. PF5-6]